MKFLKCAVLPAIAGWGTALLFLLAFSMFLTRSDDPSSLLPVLAVVSCAMGALVCGGLSALLEGSEKRVMGLFAGLLMVFLQLLCSLSPGGNKGIIFPLSIGIGQVGISLLVYFLSKKKGSGARKKIKRAAKKRYRGR